MVLPLPRLVEDHRLPPAVGERDVDGDRHRRATRRPSREERQARVDELEPADAGGEVVVVRPSCVHVEQELLPLRAEAVAEDLVVGDLAPLAAEVIGRRQVGVPDRHRRGVPRLDPAVEQAGDRGAVRAVDLELHELLALHAHRPGGVDLRDDAAGQLEDGVRRVVRRRVVPLALLVPPLGDVGDGLGGDRLDRAEEVLQDVVPVAEHVEDHPAAVLRAVVPAGALGGQAVALEHPVAELPADREDPAEEAGVDEPLELHQSRQVELVVHDAVDDAAASRPPRRAPRPPRRSRRSASRCRRACRRQPP